MKEFKLSTLIESKSFQKAGDETKTLVLELFCKAGIETQEQALRLCESASKGREVTTVLNYLSLLSTSEYLTRPCRPFNPPPLTPATPPKDELKLKGYRVTSEILKILAQHPNGISRKGIVGELAKKGINASIAETLASLKRKEFIYTENTEGAGKKKRYLYFLKLTKHELYPPEAIEPESIATIKKLTSKGYSTTEIALRCGLPREVVEEKVAKRSRRKAS